MGCLDARAQGGQDGPADGTDLPRVLVLGDSISIGYTPFVRRELEGEAVVVRPVLDDGGPENCEGTTAGLANMDRWLAAGGGKWDVIHFNWGLHDIKRVDPVTGKNSDDPGDPRQAEPEVYRRQLRALVAKLRATGATLVFATTTPVPEGARPLRDVADAARYNEIAKEVMAESPGVRTDDLYAFALPRLAEIQRPANVHFTEAGSEALAAEVAKHIRAALRDVAAAPPDR
jgi:acyl-CoA thioesterase-1